MEIGFIEKNPAGGAITVVVVERASQPRCCSCMWDRTRVCVKVAVDDLTDEVLGRRLESA